MMATDAENHRPMSNATHTVSPSPPELSHLPPDVRTVLESARSVVGLESRDELIEMAVGGEDRYDVEYDMPGGGVMGEATVVRCRNGVAVNYEEPYMRRRDPECMVIADDLPTDKTHFRTRFGQAFEQVRDDIICWLREQHLLAMAFRAGDAELGYDALLVGPRNASFFAAALADLQGMIPWTKLPADFRPRAVIYLAPPFRHTHCNGKQVVIHNRQPGLHEIFSLNLYPGPSAKKGVYGILLNIGEEEGWVTMHGSTVQVVTPYDNVVTISHEAASGGGKSEMIEYPHREADGRLRLGENIQTGERVYLPLGRGCTLRPVTDDMALCHPQLQNGSRKLVVTDAENGWFVRVNHITRYGTDPHLEGLCIHPSQPLLFLNIDAEPKSTALLWEHIFDEDGKPCPNPRVVLPRRMVPDVVDVPVEIDIRSFGVRTPACTRQHPSYGIIGFLHSLPPALAWLWRLVSPRGHANPSITEAGVLTSEGVGSYWPFATGRRVDQANLLLDQIAATPGTRYTLSPNQHVGAWRVGFMPQWTAREYLARRGDAGLSADQLNPARNPLLGYVPASMNVEGTVIDQQLLRVKLQPEVGEEAYDQGAAVLYDFFLRELELYRHQPDLTALGHEIIACCFDRGNIGDFTRLL